MIFDKYKPIFRSRINQANVPLNGADDVKVIFT